MKKRLMVWALCASVLMMSAMPLHGAFAEQSEGETTVAPVVEATATAVIQTATDAPETEAPATEAPVTEAPATETPATETPATEAPATEVPATETPAAEASPSVDPESTPEAQESVAPEIQVKFTVEVEEGTTAKTAAAEVNLRAKPSRESESLDVIIEKDTAVEPIEKVGLTSGEIWYRVEYEREDERFEGYILDQLLEVTEPAPADTAAPTETPAEETPAPEAETDAAALTEAIKNVPIRIEADSDVLIYGDEVRLVAEIPEELSGMAFQWQQTNAVGDWVDVPGANAPELTVVLSADNAAASWRILFTIE